MKNFTLSVATVLAMSTFAIAGGDIAPVEPMVEEVAPASNSGFYIGGAFSLSTTEIDSHSNYGYIGGDNYDSYYSESYDRNAFMLQAGYQFNDYIAIEGRYWGSMDKNEWSNSYYMNDTLQSSGSWSDGDWSAWGVYAKPMYPVTESVSVYGLLGYGNVSVDDNWWYGQSMLDENVFQWGIGASYKITENASVFIDYVQLCSGEDQGPYDAGDYYWDYESYDWEVSLYTVNIGLSYKF